MQELMLIGVTLTFMSLGVVSPFIMSLGYIWVDTLLPHRLSYGLLGSLQLAFIFGAGAVGIYLAKDRKFPPRISIVHALCGVLAIWITLTTSWALVPLQAFGKWDASVKTLVFVMFMPFVFRTRVQIEAFLMVFIFSAAGHLLPWGLKTMATGGGYQLSLGLMSVNSTMLAESSAVAGVTMMFIPLLLWMRQHSLIIPWPNARLWTATSLIIIYVIANIGTFARTGLIGMGVVGTALLTRTKRKLLYIVVAALLAGVAFYFTSDKWTARISTIGDYETEGSALVRLLVWKWTLTFVTSHPFGGGFNCYYINVLSVPQPNGEVSILTGKAFHNIYMAALGEHGYPGLALYVSVLGLTLWRLQKTIWVAKERPDLLWAADLARANQVALLVLMACGNFVDISFNFLVWDLVALGLCVNAHVQQVLDPRMTIAQKLADRARAIRGDYAGAPTPGAKPIPGAAPAPAAIPVTIRTLPQMR